MLTIAIIEDGQILDSQDVSREDFENLSSIGALTLLREMSI